jgi:hypothetical protein
MFASCTLLIVDPGQACWKLWNLSFLWCHAPSVQKATMVCARETGREVAGDPIFSFHGRARFIHLYSITSQQRIANIAKFSIDTSGGQDTNLLRHRTVSIIACSRLSPSSLTRVLEHCVKRWHHGSSPSFAMAEVNHPLLLYFMSRVSGYPVGTV